MAPRSWPGLFCLLSLGLGCGGTLAPPPAGGGGTMTVPPVDGGGGGALMSAQCPAQGTTVSVAGATMPAPEELASVPDTGDLSFVFDDQSVYWVSYAATGSFLGGGPTAIAGYSLRLGEGTPQLLWRQERPGYRSFFSGLRSSGTDLAWMEFFPSKPPTSGTLYALPKSGGPATVVLEDVSTTSIKGGLRMLGADDERVYLSPISPVGISAVVRTTGGLASHIATADAPTLLAFDGVHIYWIEADALWRARRDGSGAQLLAAGLPAADALAVNDGIAWIALGRLAPKRLARVTVGGAQASCTVLAPWPEGGREAQLLADARGVHVALAETSGQTADSVWSIRADGGGAWRLLAAQDGRRVRLLASQPEGLLLATSRPEGDGWAIARLPGTTVPSP